MSYHPGQRLVLWQSFQKSVGFAMALAVAILSAYSIVANLDRAATEMAKNSTLDGNRLADEYDHLWSHLYENTAERTLLELISRGRDLSSESVVQAPYNESVLKKWQDHVYNAYSESGGRATTEASATT